MPTTRAVRRPVGQVKLLTALLGHLQKAGSNINQLARRVNSGDTPLSRDISKALVACRQIAMRAKDALDGNM